MTALPGAGALAPGTPEPDPELEPDEDDPPVDGDGEDDEPVLVLLSSLSCWANGSLLANRLKDASWPSCTAGAEDEMSEEPPVVLGG